MDQIRPVKERWVVCAAMKMKDGTIIPGIRHFSPEMRINLNRIYGRSYHLEVEEQGFVDQWGKFMDRKEAWKVAEANEQIRYQCSVPGELYSENLY